jgi:hypothetical protein
MTETGRPAWVDDELFPFESRFVAIDGHTVHYVDEGSGPTAWPITGAPHVEVAYHLLGGPLGRLLNRQFTLFVNTMIPAGHRLRNLTAGEMAHFAAPARRDASAVFARRITASRAFLANIEGAGHFVQSDASDQFAAALRDSRAGSGGPMATRTDE